jgi:trimeric autotransporter adhesin
VANFADPNVGTNIPVSVSGLTLSGASAGNYTLIQPVGLTANITANGVSITSGVTANNKVYDGTTAATISLTSVTLAGVASGDTVSLSTNGYVANFAGAGVGTGIGVTVNGLSLTGSNAANYTLVQPVGLMASITAKALMIGSAAPQPVITSIRLTNGVVTITWNSVSGGIYRLQYINSLNGGGWSDLSPDVTATGLTATQTDAVGNVTQRFYRIEVLNSGISANNKMYDGTTVATITSNSVVLAGVVNGDTVGLSTNGYAANFASAAVGTGIGVTLSGLSLTGSSASNYTLIQPIALTANITPATLTVIADNKSKTYGLPNPPFTFNYTGFVNSEGAGVLAGAPSLSTSATTNSPPGQYDITVGVGTLSATNYIFTFVNGTLTVFGPQISSALLSGNRVTFGWLTLAGQTYQIESTTNLITGTWTSLGAPIVGSGDPVIVTNGSSAFPQSFFRLRISP